MEYSAPTAAIPEPGAWALMLAGIGAVGVVTRRRQKVGTAAALA